jgi:hypothetical protein
MTPIQTLLKHSEECQSSTGKPLIVKHSDFSNQTLIEGGGNFKGYDYLIIFRSFGFRCAYVAINSLHPFYNCNDYDDFNEDLAVHGDITFFGTPYLIESEGEEKWIGFDGGHAFDLRDTEMIKHCFPDNLEHSEMYNNIIINSPFPAFIRDYSFMENECKRLINQLIEKEKNE